MARRPRVFGPGILYHVIVRGNHRQKTFLIEGDYQTYLEKLDRYRKRFGVTVYGYCLMSNHVHLLVETDSQPLSRFMQGLQQSYTQYFNRKHGKVGHLFQGRYKAIVCEKDEYLLTLVRYIHLNPIRAKLVHKVDDYPYSGHREYSGARVSDVLEPRRILDMLGGRAGYRKFIQEGVKDGHQEEYYDVIDQRFLGDENFAEKLKVIADEEHETPKPKTPIMTALRGAARALEVEPAVLSGADRSWQTSRCRALVAYVLIRQFGYKLKDVAKCLGRDLATVSSLVSRYSGRMAEDEGLKKQAARIAKHCQE
jgi:REP element-mobilizing transposase RayT